MKETAVSTKRKPILSFMEYLALKEQTNPSLHKTKQYVVRRKSKTST